MRIKQPGEPRELEVELLERIGSAIRARIDGREVRAEFEALPDGSALLRLGERRLRIFGARRGTSLLVAAGPLSVEYAPAEAGRAAAHRGLATPEVTAPMPAKVLKILVSEGARVEAGDTLIVLEAMKMEIPLSAESPAEVRRIRVEVGQMVDHGAVLIELSPLAAPSASESPPQDA